MNSSEHRLHSINLGSVLSCSDSKLLFISVITSIRYSRLSFAPVSGNSLLQISHLFTSIFTSLSGGISGSGGRFPYFLVNSCLCQSINFFIKMPYQLTPIQQSSVTKKREVWDFHFSIELIFISNSSLPMGFLITFKFTCPCGLSSSSLNFSWLAVSMLHLILGSSSIIRRYNSRPFRSGIM